MVRYKLLFIALILLMAPATARPAELICRQADREAKIDCLIQALSSEEVEKRRQAAEEFATWRSLQDERVLPVLIEALSDEDPRVRQSALRAVGAYGREAKEALPAVKKAMRGADRQVQILARIAYHQIMGGHMERAESARLRSELRTLRRRQRDMRLAVNALEGGCVSRFVGGAMVTLRRLGPDAREALPQIIKKYEQCDDRSIKAAAVRAMAAVGPPETVLPYLVETLTGPYPMARKAAAESLGEMGPAAEPALDDLLAALNDPDGSVVLASVEALAGIGDPEAIPALRRTAAEYRADRSHLTKRVRKAAAKALKELND